jgi:excinuclease ABC subunit C
MKPKNTERIDLLKEKVRTFPEMPGVYLMKNAQGKIIYVGKAKDLKARVRSYFNSIADQSVKTKYLVAQIQEMDYLLTNTEVEAFLLEASLIKKHKPRYNIRLKDDKSYPYIKCTWSEEFPRFYLARKVRDDGSYYFGPYTSSFAVRESIQFMNRTYKVRDCSDAFFKNRKRPCMTHQIGRCTAPCVDLVTAKQYKDDVSSALDFLRTKDKKFLKSLNEKMKQASEDERFEVAAKFRDSIEAVKRIWEKQSVIGMDEDLDQDVLNYFGDERGTMLEMVFVRKGRVIGHRSHFLARLNASDKKEDHREWMTSYLNQYYADNVIPDQIVLPLSLGNDLEKLLNEVFKSRQKKTSRFISFSDKKQNQLLLLALKNAEEKFVKQMSQEQEKLDGLKEIQTKLNLPELPVRIECYDVSHFQGAETVGSQVVFENGEPKTDDYRRYKLTSIVGPDDFASMKEMLGRRLKHT